MDCTNSSMICKQRDTLNTSQITADSTRSSVVSHDHHMTAKALQEVEMCLFEPLIHTKDEG
jgi:hypothetical protein